MRLRANRHIWSRVKERLSRLETTIWPDLPPPRADLAALPSPSVQRRHPEGQGRPADEALRPSSFDLNVTGNCNGHCRYCSIWQNSYRNLELVYVKKFIQAIAPWAADRTRLNLVGGEPTLNENLPAILRICQELGVESTITSNGYRLANPHYAKELLGLRLQIIVISWDGFAASQDYLRGAGSFRRVIRAIENIRQIDPRSKLIVQSVICDRNIAELPDFAAWVKEQGYADQHCFQSISFDFNTTTFAADWSSKNPLWPRDPELAQRKLDELIALGQGSVSLFNPVEQLHFWKTMFRDPSKLERTGIRCDIGNFFINCCFSGEIRICPFLPPIGRIQDAELMDIFLSPEAQRRREEISSCTQLCNMLVNCRFKDLLPGNRNDAHEVS